MISIDGQHIKISRGDCQPFTITFTGDDVPEEGTEVLFTVKKSSGYSDPVIEKRIPIHDNVITVEIFNADTKDLPFGDYEWDIRIPNLYGEKEPYTPIEPQPFTIAKVIGNV